MLLFWNKIVEFADTIEEECTCALQTAGVSHECIFGITSKLVIFGWLVQTDVVSYWNSQYFLRIPE